MTHRPRTSTVVLAAIFVLTLGLYLWVRPAPPPRTELVPAVRVPVSTEPVVRPTTTTRRIATTTTTTTEPVPATSAPTTTSTSVLSTSSTTPPITLSPATSSTTRR